MLSTRILNLCISTVFATVPSASLFAQPQPTWSTTASAELMTQLNAKLTDAYLNEDLDVLRKMLDDQHIHNNVFGKALTKAQFLKDIETGVLKFEKYETPEIKWHIDRNTAIATGLIKAKAIRDGRVVPATTFLFTRIFVKRGNDWKVLLFHNTMANERTRPSDGSN